MNSDSSNRDSKIGCGIREGFHRDVLVAAILEARPEQRGEWLLPGQPPALRQRVKVQVIMESGAWGILTGRITEIGEGFVIAIAHRSTDDDSVPGGSYRLTLQYDEAMDCPWVLTQADFIDGV